MDPHPTAARRLGERSAGASLVCQSLSTSPLSYLSTHLPSVSLSPAPFCSSQWGFCHRRQHRRAGLTLCEGRCEAAQAHCPCWSSVSEATGKLVGELANSSGQNPHNWGLWKLVPELQKHNLCHQECCFTKGQTKQPSIAPEDPARVGGVRNSSRDLSGSLTSPGELTPRQGWGRRLSILSQEGALGWTGPESCAGMLVP